MEPFLELINPKLLTAPEADMAMVVYEKEVETEQADTTLVDPKFTSTYEVTLPEQQVVSQFDIGSTSRMKPSESESIPLVLKTLEELKQENEVVRSRLDRQGNMFKEQAQTNTKIEGLLQAILSRLPPQPKTKIFFMLFHVSVKYFFVIVCFSVSLSF